MGPEHPSLAMLHRAMVVSPFFLGKVVAAWSDTWVSMSVSWRLISPRVSFTAFVVLFSVLAVLVYLHRGPWLSGVLWGAGVCVKDQHHFPWAFWGSCSLGIGEALFLCLWVCLWLSWRRMRWRQTGCFCTTSTVACVVSQLQESLRGWVELFFGAPWYVYCAEFL